ncbi:LysE family translocator [Lentisalinibacter salinarum]|uniref:LysE family translocator n=1 Tax=Lentisalinibacter salinarum TaxID=2992239 RepID=UPI00386AA0F8
MSLIETLALFGIMTSLAAIPSASVALVVTRSATLGVGSGAAVSAGIVLGDLVFIGLAVLGLSVLAETLGSLFLGIRYLGAIYLLWLGLSLLRTKHGTAVPANAGNGRGSLAASFVAGFALTLGDVKAILFYLSLFPMFVDLSALQAVDVMAIVCITVTSVGGVKMLYALSARKLATMARELKIERAARKTAGTIMLGAGSYIIAKA